MDERGICDEQILYMISTKKSKKANYYSTLAKVNHTHTELEKTQKKGKFTQLMKCVIMERINSFDRTGFGQGAGRLWNEK